VRVVACSASQSDLQCLGRSRERAQAIIRSIGLDGAHDSCSSDGVLSEPDGRRVEDGKSRIDGARRRWLEDPMSRMQDGTLEATAPELVLFCPRITLEFGVII